jgi:hypothetical protein
MSPEDEKLADIVPEPMEVPDEGPSARAFPHQARFLRIAQKIQKYSSWAFSGFLTLHMSAMVVTPAISVPAAHSVFKFTNAIYQAHYVEPVLVFGSLFLHVASGFVLRSHNVYHNKKYYDKWRFNLNSVSLVGWILVPLVAGHFTATRLGPLFVLGDSSLVSVDYIVYSLHRKGLVPAASMTLMASLAAYHAVYGWAKWLSLYSKNLRWYKCAAVIIPSVLSVISLYNISSQPQVEGWLASQYDLVSEALGM